jgi:hypothetical protein
MASTEAATSRSRHALFSLVVLLAFGAGTICYGGDDAKPSTIDATTLHHKVLCGYQGWFRCPGDGTEEGWLHWSRNSNKLTADSVTVEMWPDMSDYNASERYQVPGLTGPDDKPAELFSLANRKTIERHFEWMRAYGIDGVFVQRFLVNLRKPSFDTVLSHVRSAAAKSGRVYAIGYDLTDAPKDRLYDLLVNDWKRLLDEEKLTKDNRYLHHKGKPVVFIWGSFEDRFDAALAHRIIDFFKNDDRYGVTLIGGCQWHWRTAKDKEWARAFRRFDVISPWNVGNYAITKGKRVAATHYWKADLAEADKQGMEYLPVIYPGFGWTNLKGRNADHATIPRRGGEFFWEQFVTASELGIDMAYVAMFDEVDEATAIFKVSNSPPTQARFQTYEGLPSDWYLRLTGEGTKVIRGERKADSSLPIRLREKVDR